MPRRGTDRADLTVAPWALWVGLVAAISLTLFVAIRGRWGREAPLLAVAALAGTAAGDFVAGLLGMDVLVLGEFHVIGAAIGAQAALVATSSVLTLAGPPGSSGPGRDGTGPGR